MKSVPSALGVIVGASLATIVSGACGDMTLPEVFSDGAFLRRALHTGWRLGP